MNWDMGRSMVAVSLLVVTVMSLFTVTINVGVPAEAGFPSPRVIASVKAPEMGAYTDHLPIKIIGDTNFTGTNGVTKGSGTMMDPYQITGWEIKVGPGQTGIWIEGTTKHFLVMDCWVHGGDSSMGNGSKLSNVKNGRYMNNIWNNSYMGIWLFWAQDCVISRNDVSFMNSDGIRLGYSTDNIVFENQVRNNTIGININCQSDRNSVKGNNISFSGSWGTTIQNSDYNKVTGNNFNSNCIWTPSKRQANDSDGANFWNASASGNFWSDWTGPDNDTNGIVDFKYSLEGGMGARDNYPLALAAAVPEFTPTILIAVVAFTVILCLFWRRK